MGRVFFERTPWKTVSLKSLGDTPESTMNDNPGGHPWRIPLENAPVEHPYRILPENTPKGKPVKHRPRRTPHDHPEDISGGHHGYPP
jgi:hypothetical protein